MTGLSQRDYTNLLEFRSALRSFESWSQEQARDAGLTPAQHQLLLVIKGHSDPRGPTIRDVADRLLTRHHSAVGLVDRAERSGLLRRCRDTDDARVTRLCLTQLAEDRIAALSELHIHELTRLAPVLEHLLAEPAE
ncbi:MarR family winged helix-turn-helix transcriptional regulator [Pseudonocardia spinosispora]|uniref:MarR family winged helix-turn-helix transcriptional regulator n=1 Tax=Pseudonocardia spinosispora TaxID=103441 RepID=UPI00042017A8|nr:helix-turn-helix domain-containing protein [Pseudonocardia spinosispora]